MCVYVCLCVFVSSEAPVDGQTMKCGKCSSTEVPQCMTSHYSADLVIMTVLEEISCLSCLPQQMQGS